MLLGWGWWCRTLPCLRRNRGRRWGGRRGRGSCDWLLPADFLWTGLNECALWTGSSSVQPATSAAPSIGGCMMKGFGVGAGNGLQGTVKEGGSGKTRNSFEVSHTKELRRAEQ